MPQNILEKHCRTFTISSGKGGVGKTSIVINIGLALTRLGHKVCVFDADANLANINIMLKQSPEYTLEHVINGKKSVSEIMLQSSGLYVIPGASGISEFINFSQSQQTCLLQAIKTCQQVFDFILIDSAAGISKSVLAFMQIAQQNIIIITPEPTSLTDAFSLLKVFSKQHAAKNISVIVNQAINEKQANIIFKRFSIAVKQYIGPQVEYISWVNKDSAFSSCIRQQSPLYLSKSHSVTCQRFDQLAKIINQRQPQVSIDDSIKQFLHSQSTLLPDFSDTEEETGQPQQDGLQQSIISKLKNTEINPQLAQKIIAILEQPPSSPDIKKPKNRHKQDKEGLISSIKYAQLAAQTS